MTSPFRPTSFQSWGRVVRRQYPMAKPVHLADLPSVIADPARPGHVLPVGLGRSYGDSNLNGSGGLIGLERLDRLIALDREVATVTVQAGISLSALLQVLVPEGFFIPVTPGSRFVTVGGMIANDVHGKNHAAAGTIGRWVKRLGLRRSDGTDLTLSPGDPSGLFEATIGGLGLTGIITWAEVGLEPIDSGYMLVEDFGFSSLDQYFELMEQSRDWPHRVAWIDCTSPGRGVFSRARHGDDGRLLAHTDKAKARLPMDAPGFALNPLSLKLFNITYGLAQGLKPRPRTAHYEGFFYPLDAVLEWNRLYGAKGFFQYQCVVPRAVAPEATAQLLKTIAKSGQGSFLAVLKEFGAKTSPGLLSFPAEGTTLALDFQNQGKKTLALFARLDAIVAEVGGRLYPAKDGRMPAAMFQAGYPQWPTMARLRDPAIGSDFWHRVSQPLGQN